MITIELALIISSDLCLNLNLTYIKFEGKDSVAHVTVTMSHEGLKESIFTLVFYSPF